MKEIEMTNPRVVAGRIFSSAYILLWAVVATLYFERHNFDVLWLFGMFTVPSSLLSGQLSNFLSNILHLEKDWKIIIEFAGFLILGTVQFWVIGYLAGAAWKVLLELVCRRKGPTRPVER